jgi:ABC-type transport system involved in multi-copper enzyme maturation permease subunit
MRFEMKTGNAGITTKPLSLWQIVNGKFLGALLLIVAIIPTFIYGNIQSSNARRKYGWYNRFLCGIDVTN